MIKIAIKHWIYEKCIDVLFRNLSNNFSENIKFRVGDMFEYITVRHNHDFPAFLKFYNCTIITSDCTIITSDKRILVIEYRTAERIGYANPNIEKFISYDQPMRWATPINKISDYRRKRHD